MSDNRLFVQAQTFTLAGAGCSTGATSIILSSFTQTDGTLLTLSNFGTKGYATIEPNNSSKEEAITFTGVTQNANGTATLTGVSTQLLISPYTETSGTLMAHVGGAKLIITNTAGFYDQFANKQDDETISGLYTFTQFPQKSGSTTPTGANELASKAYVDSVVGGISVTDQVLTTGLAGESVTIGKVGYLGGTQWYVADSSDVSKSVAVKLGIFQATVGSGTLVNVLTAGIDKNQSGLAGTAPYYLSTSGGISTTKGANIRLVGRAQSATTLQLEDSEQSAELLMTDGSRTYAVAGGTGGTYTLTLVPAITAYKAGQTFSFLAGTSSIAGTVTLNINSLGAKIVKKVGGTTNLAANDLRGSTIAVVQYDGTVFQLQNPVGNAPGLLGTALGFASVTNNTPQVYVGTSFANLTAASANITTSTRRAMISFNVTAEPAPNNASNILYLDVAVDGSRIGDTTNGIVYGDELSLSGNRPMSGNVVTAVLAGTVHTIALQAKVSRGSTQVNLISMYATELDIST